MEPLDFTTLGLLPSDIYLAYLQWLKRQQAAQDAREKSKAGPDSGGGLGGVGQGQGTGEFGPLAGDVKSAISGFNTARGLANAIGGLFGGIPGLGLVGPGFPASVVSAASTLAGLLGAPSGFDPSLGMPSAVDIQGIQDVQGVSAAQRAAEQAQADFNDRVASFSGPIANEAWGPAEIAGLPTYSAAGETNPGGTSMGSTSANPGGTSGTVGPGQAPGDNRDQTAEASGGVSGGNSDTSGTADSTGGSRGNDGSDRRHGGVFRASSPKTEKITWGERGTAPGGKSGETAIFIPDRFQLPGLQENERVVRAALRRSLADILAGRRRSQG
jgi:hypothetical protein